MKKVLKLLTDLFLIDGKIVILTLFKCDRKIVLREYR